MTYKLPPLSPHDHPDNHIMAWSPSEMRAIQRYAQAAVDAEREACAKVCDEIERIAWDHWDMTADPNAQGESHGATNCAAAIRNRAQGEQK